MKRKVGIGAAAAYWAVLAAGFVAMLAVDLPGHLSLDSVMELYEGRFRIRESWAPAFYAWVIGRFDKVLPGAALYVVASGLLLFGALAAYPALRKRTSWLAPPLAALMALSPLVLVYQGIVWKDVLFANVAVAGMVLLAGAAQAWDDARRRWLWLPPALLLLSAAALIRQNGVIVGVLAAIAVGWTAAGRRPRRGVLWGAGALAAIVLVSHGLEAATRPPPAPDQEGGFSKGVRILQNYDLAGALARDPALRLPASERADPRAVAAWRRLAARYYSPERGDFLDAQQAVQDAEWAIPDAAAAADWRGLILKHPLLYLRLRAEVFRWTFLTPDIGRCVPVYVGVDGPAFEMHELGLTRRWSPMDVRLSHYTAAVERTPIFSHLAYALIALAAAAFLLARRGPADVAMAALALSGLGFAASFFVISIACDFRYLYFLDLAAMASALYVAVDPSWRARRRR